MFPEMNLNISQAVSGRMTFAFKPILIPFAPKLKNWMYAKVFLTEENCKVD